VHEHDREYVSLTLGSFLTLSQLESLGFWLEECRDQSGSLNDCCPGCLVTLMASARG
jgi:hypothetical protein